MANNSPKKKSGGQRKAILIVLIALLVPITLALMVLGTPAKGAQKVADIKTTAPNQSEEATSTSKLVIGDEVFVIELADTLAKQTQGLSDRKSLPDNHIMLFAFNDAQNWGFWMKHMHFPLDMVWLDEDYRVVTAMSDILPSSYPQVFYPTKPAKYVIEANIGFVKKFTITAGTQLTVTH